MKQPKRIIPVIATIAIQLCLGTAYIWSVFQAGITESLFSGNNADAALTFSLLLAVLGIGSTIGGKMSDKIGPRLTVIIGGIVLSIGFFGASLVTSAAPWMLWVTYGVLGGLGMVLLLHHHCLRPKVVSRQERPYYGIIVSALGFGGVVFTPLVEWIIKTYGNGIAGQGELISFKVLAGIFLVVCTIGGVFIVNPPAGYAPAGWTPKTSASGAKTVDLTPSQALRKPQLYLLTFP
jgi:OFA family oxalate/formate antiporter-like MFS transporter